MSFFVVFVAAAIFIPLGRSLKRDKPGGFQQMMELLFDGLYNMIEDAVGPGAGKRFLPLIASIRRSRAGSWAFGSAGAVRPVGSLEDHAGMVCSSRGD